MGASIEMNGNDYLPNEATLDVVRAVTGWFNYVPGVSVRIESQGTNRWRFHVSFAWEGKPFAGVVYGYGGAEVVLNDDTVCSCGTGTNWNLIKFEPESLRQKLTELLFAAVEKEKDRLQQIRQKLIFAYKAQTGHGFGE